MDALTAEARERLVQLARDALEPETDEWYLPDTVRFADAEECEFIAACSPGTILALAADHESAQERADDLAAEARQRKYVHANAMSNILSRAVRAEERERELEARLTAQIIDAVLRAERAEEALAAANEALREIASLPEWARNAPRIARAALVGLEK